MLRLLTVWFLVLSVSRGAQHGSIKEDSYDVLLHSSSLTEQRAALKAILQRPHEYVPRIEKTLRDYPRLVRTDYAAANRAVYVAALLRDPAFPPVLVGILGDPAVLDECIYACPVVFALTIQACFASWPVPSTLDATLTTVTDLRAAVRQVPQTSLEVQPLDDVVKGSELEQQRKNLKGKTEEQLIQMASSASSLGESRLFAAFALKTSVTTSRNRLALYLLAMNEGRPDASGEYRDAIYEAIYRAETARARGR